MTPLTVNWIAPSSPTLRYHGGRAEEFFPSTAGWGWLEGKYLGEAAGDDAVVTLFPPRDIVGVGVDATVLVGEALAVKFFDLFRISCGDTRSLGKVLVRVISPPGDPRGAEVQLQDGTPLWKNFAGYLPGISGLCTISEDTATKLDAWARQHGYKGPKVRRVPHGARPQDIYDTGRVREMEGRVVATGERARHGVAYLGSLIYEKRVPLVVEAAKAAGVSCFLGVAVNSDRMREDIERIGELAKSYDGLTVATLGEIGKYEVLGQVRAVVTASTHEAAWVSGIEGRAAGAVAIAPLGDGCIKLHNADGLLYYDGTVDGLAARIREMHDDEKFLAEQKQQRTRWEAMGHDAKDVGAALWEWVKESCRG